jgi:cytochrome c-type biogenesis protein
MFNVSIPIAFAAGVVSFFAPCVLPLVPAYIGYIAGTTTKEIDRNGLSLYRFKMLVSSGFYILGFSMVFVILGTTAGGIGTFFRNYSLLLERLGGLIIFIFGVEFSGLVNISFLNVEKKIILPRWAKDMGYLKSFLVGVIFAFAWTPCVGPVLGSILALAAVNGTAVYGAYLLFVYSLGISLPFLIVALTLAEAPQYLKPIKRHITLITKIAGVFLMILGILLMLDLYKYVNVLI